MEALSPLINLGAIGVVLAWVLTQTNPRLEGLRVEMQEMGASIQKSLDRLTRAQMLTLISRPDVSEAMKREARDVLKEIGIDVQARIGDV